MKWATNYRAQVVLLLVLGTAVAFGIGLVLQGWWP